MSAYALASIVEFDSEAFLFGAISRSTFRRRSNYHLCASEGLFGGNSTEHSLRFERAAWEIG